MAISISKITETDNIQLFNQSKLIINLSSWGFLECPKTLLRMMM